MIAAIIFAQGTPEEIGKWVVIAIGALVALGALFKCIDWIRGKPVSKQEFEDLKVRVKNIDDFIQHLQRDQLVAAEARADKLAEKLDRLHAVRQIK